MKILVTGGSGMIGKNLQQINKTNENIWLFPNSTEMNLLKEESIDKYFNEHKPDFIVHLAANVGGLFKNLKYKVEMFRENILMNENILHIANKYNVNNGIFCCSTCIFPKNPEKYPITENMIMDGKPHDSNDSYGYSKRLLYFQCCNYNKQYNRKYICISPCNLYGKYDNFNLENSHVISGLIHKFYLASINKTELHVKTGMHSERQFMLTSDLCKILIMMINNFDDVDYDNIIFATKDEYIINIIKIISNNFSDVKYDIIEQEDGQIKKTCSYDLFNKNFSNFNLTHIEKGIFETIEWFKNNYDTIRK